MKDTLFKLPDLISIEYPLASDDKTMEISLSYRDDPVEIMGISGGVTRILVGKYTRDEDGFWVKEQSA